MAGIQKKADSNDRQREQKVAESASESAIVAVPKQKAVVASKTYGKGKVIARKQGSTGHLAFPPSRQEAWVTLWISPEVLLCSETSTKKDIMQCYKRRKLHATH